MRKFMMLAAALMLAAACTKEDDGELEPKTSPETRGSMTNDSIKTDSTTISGFYIDDEWKEFPVVEF